MDLVDHTLPIGATVKDAAKRRLELIDNCTTVRPRPNWKSLDIQSLLLSEIESLRDTLAPFIWRLNQLRCPILRLPPELLRFIFDHVIQSMDVSVYFSRSSPRNWLFLGHVSSQFRSVLLGMHALWADTVFSLDLRDAHEELLRRAHQAPISIDLHQGHSETLLDFAARHSTRSRIIAARSSAAVGRLAPRFLNEIFPYLESVKLSHTPLPMGPPSQEHMDVEASLALTASAYHSPMASTPNLRELSLSSVFIPFNASTLRKLSLWLPEENVTGAVLSAAPFLDMLRRCNNLESLHLSSWIPELPSDFMSHTVIELTALQYIYMYGIPSRVARLWSVIRIPPSAKLDVSLPKGYGFTSQVESISALGSHLHDEPMAYKFEVIGQTVDQIITFRLLTAALESDPDATSVHRLQLSYEKNWQTVFQLELTSEIWTPSDIGQAVQRFCVQFSLAEIAILDTNYDIVVATDPIIYTNFPAIQALRLQIFTPEMLRALALPPPASHPSARGTSTVIYPNLHTLALLMIYSLEDEDVDAVANMLIERAGYGVPIEVLDLEITENEEEILECHLERLRKLVPTFYEPD